MTPHRHWFCSYTPCRTPIRLANDKVVYSVGKGSICFIPSLNNRPGRLLEFQDVLHVPDLCSNLLSVLYLTKKRQFHVHIDASHMRFKRHGKLLFTADINNHNAAHLNSSTLPMSDFAGMVSTCPLNESLWHRRFCHLNRGDIKKIVQGDLVTGVVIKSKESMDPICEPCLAGKQHRVAAPKVAQNRASEPLQLVHSDVHGPLPVQSRHHSKYWITFIDDCTRFWVVLPLRDKAGAFAAFKQFKALAENQLNAKIKALRDDKGGEYMSTEWETFCTVNGIARQHTVRSEPHQNGVAEHANRTLHEAVISMLSEAHLPPTFWWDAVGAFVHVHNCSPTAALHNTTPYELWYKSKPDVAHFRVFGCTAYVHIKKDKRKQLQSHTQKCVFIGYPTQYKAWLFWNPITKKEIVSNTAEFDERFFPGTSTKPIDWPPLSPNLGTPQEPENQVGEGIGVIPLSPSRFSAPAPAPSEDSDDSESVKSQEEDEIPAPAQEPPQERPVTPPAPPEPVTPVQSPSIQRKRVLTSPASDLSSPEHQSVKLAIEGVSANFAL